MSILPDSFCSYRKGRLLQKLSEAALYCSVTIPTQYLRASPLASNVSTARDKRLNELLEASGQASDGLLLSERFRQNSVLRRQYLETISQPDWISTFSLSSNFESLGKRDPSFAGSIQTTSLIQFQNNFEAESRWSILYSPHNMSVLPSAPSFSPLLENLTLSYGKMRSAELSVGILKEQALLVPVPLSGQFSGLSANIHPLKNKTNSHATQFGFQVEHGWTAPVPLKIKLKNIQRTRPALSLTMNNELGSLEGRTSLEWYTDPDRSIGLLSSNRNNRHTWSEQGTQKKWRLFTLESSFELKLLRETRLKVFASRISNSLVPSTRAGWSSSLLFAQNYEFSQALGSFELNTTIFNAPSDSIPHFRLPNELSPASRGVLSALSISILPVSLKNHELRVRLNYLRESLPHTLQPTYCQQPNIKENTLCSFFFGQFSIVRTLGSNL